LTNKARAQRSLYKLLAGIIVSVVIIVLGSHAAYRYLSQRNEQVEDMKRNSALSIATLQKNISTLIESYAINEYVNLINTEVEQRHHFAIIVNDYNMGKILATEAYISGKIHDASGQIIDYNPDDPLHRQWLDTCFYTVRAPITTASGALLGHIAVYVTDAQMREELNRILMQNLISSAMIALLLIVLIHIAVRHLLVRPLSKIVTVIGKTDADGIPTAPIPNLAYVEISTLTNTMNTMVEVIKRSRKQLKDEKDALLVEHGRLQQITAELALSRDRFEQLAEASPSGIWETTPDGLNTYVSRQWCQITGLSADAAAGQGWASALHPEDRERVFQEWTKQAAAGRSYRAEFRFKRLDGSVVWVLNTATSIDGDSGAIESWVGTITDISEGKQQQAEILQQRLRLQNIIEGTRVGTWEWNVQTGETHFNERWAEIIGYRLEELAPINIATWMQFAHPDDLASSSARLEQHFSGQSGHYECEVRMRHKDGHWVWVLDRGMVVSRCPHGQPEWMAGTHWDITERKNNEIALAERTQALARANTELEQLATVFTHTREGIVITDPQGDIVDVNDAFCRITGYSRDEAIGQNTRLLKSERHEPEFYVELWRALSEQGDWSGEIWNRRKNGEEYAELLTISAVRDAGGLTRHYVALFADITAQKDHQRQLEHIANYDALTGLPNRLLLADRLHQAMTRAKRRNESLALAYLDLDGFKAINDNHGHNAGDHLLTVIAERMKQCLRESDTIARLGGDEFVVVLADLANIKTSEPFILRLLAAASQPVPYKDELLHVSSSIGIAFYSPADDANADLLLREADQAMYQAKQAGKNRFHVFDSEQDRAVRGHHENIARIRQALTNKEFVLHFQPKVNMRSGALIGVEALIRWQHPERGLLSPGLFLPEIENHPLGIELGEWVIDTALAQIEAWQVDGFTLSVSVNIAGNHLQQAGFVDSLRDLLARHPSVRPDALELEVLETSALEDIAHVSAVIAECATLGIDFALDDFGTGYSSLTYLKRLPAQILKIDQSFVHDMQDDPEDLAILEGVLGLAMAFRRRAIAEGVETISHGEMLLDLGCELAQGYGIARPMPAAEIPKWSAIWQPGVTWLHRSSVSRDDLPLLFAAVEHRAWISAVAAHLKSNSDAPMLDRHACRFGAWLEDEGRARYGNHPAFPRIEALHRQVHERVQSLLTMAMNGGSKEALNQLDELYQQRNRLLEQLKQIC